MCACESPMQDLSDEPRRIQSWVSRSWLQQTSEKDFGLQSLTTQTCAASSRRGNAETRTCWLVCSLCRICGEVLMTWISKLSTTSLSNASSASRVPILSHDAIQAFVTLQLLWVSQTYENSLVVLSCKLRIANRTYSINSLGTRGTKSTTPG